MYSAGIALALFFTGRKLFGVILGAASVAVTLLLVFVVIPHFSYWGHYAYIGGGARGLRSVSAALATFGQHLFSLHGLLFVLLIAFTAGVGVCRPAILIVLPTVLFRMMANDPVYLDFRFQYGVLLTGVAFMAMIDGWAWLSGHRAVVARWVRTVQATLVIIGVMVGLTLAPALLLLRQLHGSDDVVAAKIAVESQIPDGATVAADPFLVSQIVDRTDVQVAHTSWQDETGAPIVVDYVFLNIASFADGNLSSPWVIPLIDRLIGPGGGYTIIDMVGTFVLLKRNGP